MVKNPGVSGWPTKKRTVPPCEVQKVNLKADESGAPTAMHEEHCLPPFYMYTIKFQEMIHA